MPHRQMTISADPRQLKAVRDAVLELAGPCLGNSAHLFVLAVDEAVSNVMRHGAGKAADAGPVKGAEIVVDIAAGRGRVEVRIADGGPAYNPCAARSDAPPERVRQRKRGGMGLSIIRAVMDEVRYTRAKGLRNELRLIKYFDPQAAKE